MNSKSLREKALIAVVGVIMLYAVAVVLWFVSQEDAWKRAAKAYDRAKKTYESERKLIGERQQWNDAYEEEKAQMPTFAFGKSTDTTPRSTISPSCSASPARKSRRATFSSCRSR